MLTQQCEEVENYCSTERSGRKMLQCREKQQEANAVQREAAVRYDNIEE